MIGPLRARIAPPGSLRGRIVTSLGLTTAQFASQAALRLVSTIVLTRLLAPEVYGVFAVVLVWRYILEMISDIGIRSVILTREGELDAPFLQTCFTASILRGLLIAGAMMAIGGTVLALQIAGVFSEATAYADPTLPSAIAALGILGVLRGLESMNRYAAEREMHFGRVTAGMIVSNVAGLIATIALAIWLRTVWALVWGAMIQTTVLTIWSHAVFRGAPMRPAFDRDAARVIWARGRWILGQSSLTAASQAADRLLLGLVVSAEIFGFYHIARQLSGIVESFLKAAHSQMGLQVFTRLMEMPERFRENYYRYRVFFDAIAGLTAGGLVVVARPLVDVVFDPRYAPVAGILQFLALGILLAGPLLLREAYSARRQFREMTILALASAVTLWIGLILALLVFESLPAAFLVIALHRLPEAAILWVMGHREGWVRPAFETLPLAFLGCGAAIGWGVVVMVETLG